MIKIIEANQSKPYELMKNKLFHGTQYKELLTIVKNNRPELSVDEIISMFKDISNGGCSSAMLANIVANRMYTNEEEFKEKFGFPLAIKGTNKLDYNKIMVDIASRFYKVGKISLHKYDEYTFGSIIEAAKTLLKKEYATEQEAVLDLFKHNIILNGKNQKGELLFKSTLPKSVTYIGTISEVAKKYFGIDNIKTEEELRNICRQYNIDLKCEDFELNQKLTGLTTNNFNFWCEYYFNTHNIEETLVSTSIATRGFESEEHLIEHLLNLLAEDTSISVGVGPGKDVSMHTDKKMSWIKISEKYAGHVMQFKGFNSDKDILVSSYGMDYIIPKEYMNELEFNKISKQSITKENEEDLNKQL